MANVVNMVGLTAQDKENQIIDGTLSTYWNPFVTNIPSYAFANQSNLVSIDLFKASLFTGTNAFKNCTSLDTVNLESCLWSDDSEAVYDARSMYNQFAIGEVETLTNVYTAMSSKTTLSVYTFKPLLNVNLNVSVVDTTFLNGGYLTTSTNKMDVYICKIDQFESYSTLYIPSSYYSDASFAYQGLSYYYTVVGSRDYFAQFHSSFYNFYITYSSNMANHFIAKLWPQTVTLNNCSSIQTHGFSDGLFMHCSELISVRMPKLTVIPSSTFYACRKLSFLELGAITDVYSHAFGYCYDLTGETLDFTQLSNIGYAGFGHCGFLSISLPHSQLSLSSHAFASSPYLSQVTILGSIILPSWCFGGCSRLKTVSLPNITSLSSYCFQSCAELSEITLPNLMSNAFNASALQPFQYCTQLSSLTFPTITSLASYIIPSAVTYLSIPLINNFNYNTILSRKESVLNLTISSTCTFLMRSFALSSFSYVDDVFHQWRTSYRHTGIWPTFANFTSLTINNLSFLSMTTYVSGGTKYLGYFDSETTYLSLPNLQSYFYSGINQHAFRGAIQWEFISGASYSATYFGGSYVSGTALDSLRELYIPNISIIKSGTFIGLSSLSKIDITNTSIIESQAFAYCTALRTVIMPNIQSIGLQAFMDTRVNTSNLSNITVIGAEAFRNAGINEISIDGPIESIATRTFGNCSVLFAVNLPHIKYLGQEAFISCSNLKRISVPETITISASAFRGCNTLNIISLPKVTNISESAFYGCIALSSIYLTNSQMVTLGSDSTVSITGVFAIAPSTKFYVPSSLVETYQNAVNWQAYSSRIFAIE